MNFSGELFTYHGRLTAFESGPLESTKTLVYIPGVGEGFNFVPFLKPLSTMLSSKNWSLVQVQLDSTLDGFGYSSLQKDSEQLDALVNHLKSKRNKKTIVFMGHSTGSQDCFWHNKYGATNQQVSAYILQAPVSDRENLLPNLDKFDYYINLATRLRSENRGNELLPIEAMGTPVTADRYYSFCSKGGDDDVYSTDLTEEEIKKLYTGVFRPICWIYGEDDECYVSKQEPSVVMKRYQRLCPAIKETHIVPKADHCITREDSQAVFCSIVGSFIDTTVK